jgi:hypothetical protein
MCRKNAFKQHGDGLAKANASPRTDQQMERIMSQWTDSVWFLCERGHDVVTLDEIATTKSEM